MIDNHHELVIPKPASQDDHAVFYIFSDWTNYYFGSGSHPTYVEVEDAIILINEKRFNPVSMDLIEGHYPVLQALVIGQGQFQAGLLVESN